jgi:hypothetical protein
MSSAPRGSLGRQANGGLECRGDRHRPGDRDRRPVPARPVGPPATGDPAVPALEQDNGEGERLLLVVGGAFSTREAAEQANVGIGVGEMQGFYVPPTAQFPGLQERLGKASGDYVLVSAFRTGRGAKEFMDLVQAAGASAFITPRLENLGYEYVGLGQEADPDGGGALTEPIPGLTT